MVLPDPASVLYRQGAGEAWVARVARVGGQAFTDLPDLLDAARGEYVPAGDFSLVFAPSIGRAR